MRARHQLPMSFGRETGVVVGAGAAGACEGVTGTTVGLGAAGAAGVLEDVAEADAEADAEAEAEADALAEALGLAVAELDADADALAEAEADAEGVAVAVGVAVSVGSAAGAAAPAGTARPEKRTPAAATATTEVVSAVPTERLTSHMRSIITRPTGAGSNRGNLGESVYSSESSLLTRGMRAQYEAQGAEHRPHGGFGHGQRNVRQFQQCAVLGGHRGDRTGEKKCVRRASRHRHRHVTDEVDGSISCLTTAQIGEEVTQLPLEFSDRPRRIHDSDEFTGLCPLAYVSVLATGN